MMADLADAFMALPGGMGTFDEFIEMVTWAQLGFHRKPCGLLNVAGYFDKLIGFLDQAVEEGFVKPQHRGLVMVERDHRRLLERMRRHNSPVAEPSTTREDR
jgi:uncharacterized protein (TIGR00730 family)